jgi:hypothetical protein
MTIYLLTVRGTASTADPEAARKLHNDTAGTDAGVDAARALGDLSHNVFVPLEGGGSELLFVDTWNSLSGMEAFFADPHVQAGAAELFTSRDAVAWIPSEFVEFHLPVPSDRSPVALGLLRATVASMDAARAAFREVAAANLNKARLHGQISHQTFQRATPEGPSATELLGVDLWFDLDGMARYYADPHTYDALGGVFTGPPETSVWAPAPGSWREW